MACRIVVGLKDNVRDARGECGADPHEVLPVGAVLGPFHGLEDEQVDQRRDRPRGDHPV